MQIFVRKKEGIERLLKLVTPSVDPQRASSPSLGRGNDRILEQIRQAETELKRLPSPTMAIMTGKDLDKLRTQRKALDSRLQRLRSELKNRE